MTDTTPVTSVNVAGAGLVFQFLGDISLNGPFYDPRLIEFNRRKSNLPFVAGLSLGFGARKMTVVAITETLN